MGHNGYLTPAHSEGGHRKPGTSPIESKSSQGVVAKLAEQDVAIAAKPLLCELLERQNLG